MKEHSKLPWTGGYGNDVGPDDDGFWEWFEILDAKDETVAKLDYGRGYEAQVKRDLEFILKCVNSHDKLIGALRVCIDLLDEPDTLEIRTRINAFITEVN